MKLAPRFLALVLCAVFPLPLEAAGGSEALPPVLGPGAALQVVLGLGLVLALLAVTTWLLKRLSPQLGSSAGMVKVVAAAAVGQRERVVLVEVADTWVVIGVAPGRINALHTMKKIEGYPGAGTAASEESRFAGWLKRAKERRHDK